MGTLNLPHVPVTCQASFSLLDFEFERQGFGCLGLFKALQGSLGCLGACLWEQL
jgi:hypothetical protein